MGDLKHVLRLSMGDPNHVPRLSSPVLIGCLFSRTAELVVTVSYNTSSIWNSRTGDLVTVVSNPMITNDMLGKHGCNRLIQSHQGPMPAKIRGDTIVIWDSFTGSTIYTIHAKNVQNGALSPDGVHMAMVIFDLLSHCRHIEIWNVQTTTHVRTIHNECEKIVGWAWWNVSYSLDGSMLVGASSNNTAKVWDPHDGSCVNVLQGHDNVVAECAFSPRESTLIATTSMDTTVKLWHARTSVCLDTLIGHEEPVYKCVFSPDGVYLASISSDHTTRVWNVYAGTCVHIIRHASNVMWCDFSFDGSLLVTASWNDYEACIWALPAALRNNVNLLLMILVCNCHHDRSARLPPELWDGMYIQWFC